MVCAGSTGIRNCGTFSANAPHFHGKRHRNPAKDGRQRHGHQSLALFVGEKWRTCRHVLKYHIHIHIYTYTHIHVYMLTSIVITIIIASINSQSKNQQFLFQAANSINVMYMTKGLSALAHGSTSDPDPIYINPVRTRIHVEAIAIRSRST